MKKTRTVRAFTKAVNEADRTVEQIVSVFENVDLGKDRVKTHAFEESLAEWAADGDPIPVIWSHMWDDPFAHVGLVIEAKELLPGDALLPPELAELGGLYVKEQYDEGPFADQVFKLLKERRVREASFAYDVREEKKNADGTTDLIRLGLIEVGPTLKGMNPMVTTLKSWRADLAAELVKAGATQEVADAAVAAVKTFPSHTFLPKDGDPDRCSICDLTRNTVGHLNLLSGEPEGAKAVVTLTGSIEETLDSYYAAAVDFAVEQNMGNGGFYALHSEGTYLDEGRAIYCIEGWSDPWNEGAFFEFRFATGDDGEISVESYTEVSIEAAVRPKTRGSALKAATLRTLGRDGHHPGKAKGKAAKAEDPESEDREGTGDTGEAERALLEIDATAIELGTSLDT